MAGPAFAVGASICASVVCAGILNDQVRPIEQPLTVTLFVPSESIVQREGSIYGAIVCPPPSRANSDDGGCSNDGEKKQPFFFRDKPSYQPNDIRPVTVLEYVNRKLGYGAVISGIQESKDNLGRQALFVTAVVPRK